MTYFLCWFLVLASRQFGWAAMDIVMVMKLGRGNMGSGGIPLVLLLEYGFFVFFYCLSDQCFR